MWQQEQQRDREPVLPLYALPPDALLLDAVPLESEGGANYQGLRRLLQQQQWYRANQATNHLIEAMCQTVVGWVDEDAIKKLPRADLRTIDRLWVAVSSGKFGFSVQRKIWLELGIANLDAAHVEDVDLDKFRDAVGWLFCEKHISYRNAPFDLSTAPNGHFPRWGGEWNWDNPDPAQWEYGSEIAATAFRKVDPDTDAAYYSRQQEQKAGIGSGQISASSSRSASSTESVANGTVDPTDDVPLERAKNVLRLGDYSGIWHSHAVKFSIQQIFPAGEFNGVGEFVGGPHSGIQFGFTGKIGGRLTIARDVGIGSQIASDTNFEIEGDSIIWQGLAKGVGIGDVGLPFEFRAESIGSERIDRGSSKFKEDNLPVKKD